jgi:hypothetical protein
MTRGRRRRRETILSVGAVLLLAVAAFGVLAYRLSSSPTNVTHLLDELLPNPFGLRFTSPDRPADFTGVVTIAWATAKQQPAEVLLRYTSDPLPSCGACPRPTWHVLARLPGEVTSYRWDTSSLPSGAYRVEVIATKEQDRQSVYSSLLRINGGSRAGAKGSRRLAGDR